MVKVSRRTFKAQQLFVLGAIVHNILVGMHRTLNFLGLLLYNIVKIHVLYQLLWDKFELFAVNKTLKNAILGRDNIFAADFTECVTTRDHDWTTLFKIK